MSLQKKLSTIKLIIPLLILSGAFSVFGQSELPAQGRTLGVGARAMGMGGAFSSVADDYTATYWNPAGLALIRKMEFFASLPHVKYKNEASFDSNNNIREENFTKMDAIGFAFPIPTYRGSLVFAFGYNRIKNFDNAFSLNWTEPSETPPYTMNWDNLTKGHLGQYVVSGAIDLSPNLSAGASLNFWRGENEAQFNYIERNDPYLWWIQDEETRDTTWYKLTEYTSDEIITSKLSCVNLKLGALYRLGRIMRFACNIELPHTLKIKENSTETTNWNWLEYYEDEWVISEPEYYDDGFAAEYKIRTPFKFGAGTSVYLPMLIVSGDIQYVDWSQMEYKTAPPFTKMEPVFMDNEWVYVDSTQVEINRDIRKTYRATARVNLGAEFSIPFLNSQFRAGMLYDPSPLKKAKSKNDRKFFTLGAGFLLDKQMKLDLAWIHGWWENSVANFTEQIDPLNEKIQVNHFEVSLAIRF